MFFAPDGAKQTSAITSSFSEPAPLHDEDDAVGSLLLAGSSNGVGRALAGFRRNPSRWRLSPLFPVALYLVVRQHPRNTS